MGKTDAPPSFANLIEEAQKTPAGGGLGIDVSSPFALPIPDDHQVVNLDNEDPAKVPGIPKYNYEAHVKFYQLPSDTQEYENTLNEILNGNAILRFEDRHFTKEGDCVVIINYLTYKPPPEEKDDDDEEERRRPKN